MGRKPKQRQFPTKRKAKQAVPRTITTSKLQKPKKPRSQEPGKPIIPFSPNDSLLLVGEGDFSFANAVLNHHSFSSLIATSYDTREEVLRKYPQTSAHIEHLCENECDVLHGIDAGKLETVKRLKKKRFDTIIFMFPHIGGLSTDQDRQVRLNQELLLKFFKSATKLLSPHGTIVVTLFDGLPYTLWNLRALAKSSGLQSQRSFKFQSNVYPGYRHARTLGNINGESAWKGENRAARSCIFELREGPQEDLRNRKLAEGLRNDSSDAA